MRFTDGVKLLDLNEAFIIDNETKEALVAEDPRSAEIIKPVLRGRDIQRYRAEWAGRWLIAAHNGYGDVPPVEIDDYPAIKDFLDGHYEMLAKRYDKGKTPYNLRNCAYHADFLKEKLFWIDLADEGRFSYVDRAMFAVNSVYMLTGSSVKFLCAVLNSKLITWFVNHTAVTSGMGATRWFGYVVEAIPVPEAAEPARFELEQITSLVLEAMHVQSISDTCDREQQLNRLVYELYGLTEDEIRAING